MKSMPVEPASQITAIFMFEQGVTDILCLHHKEQTSVTEVLFNRVLCVCILFIFVFDFYLYLLLLNGVFCICVCFVFVFALYLYSFCIYICICYCFYTISRSFCSTGCLYQNKRLVKCQPTVANIVNSIVMYLYVVKEKGSTKC